MMRLSPYHDKFENWFLETFHNQTGMVFSQVGESLREIGVGISISTFVMIFLDNQLNLSKTLISMLVTTLLWYSNLTLLALSKRND